MNKSNTYDGMRLVQLWLVGMLLLLLLMIGVGGITRLTESGLSMVEWKPIMGTLPPMGQEAWHEAFEKYQAFPQYQLINREMSLGEFKSIFFWEYLHRLLGRVIGLAFAVPFLLFLATGRLRKGLAWKLAVAFLLGGLQGLLGWYMVKSGLVDVPRVSHYRLAAHLLLAFSIFAYLLWILLSIVPMEVKRSWGRPSSVLRRLSGAYLVLLLLQVLYGAFTAGLRAGYAFNTWPTMLGRWVPPGWLQFEPAWRNFLENPTTVQFLHRNAAWALLLLAVMIWSFSARKGWAPRVRLWLHLLPAATLLQFALGVSTLVLKVPVSLAAAHQVMACLLVGVSVALIHDLRGQAALQPEGEADRELPDSEAHLAAPGPGPEPAEAAPA